MNHLSILHMVLPFVILVGAKPTGADLHKLRGRGLTGQKPGRCGPARCELNPCTPDRYESEMGGPPRGKLIWHGRVRAPPLRRRLRFMSQPTQC